MTGAKNVAEVVGVISVVKLMHVKDGVAWMESDGD